MKTYFFAAVAALAIAVPAQAAVLFSDGFEAEADGTPQPILTNFTVTNPTIDIVTTPAFGITCAGGSGKCLDLDGTSGLGGILTKSSWAFVAGDIFALSFAASGNQRGTGPFADSFSAGFLLNGTTEINFDGPVLASADPFSSYTYTYTATGTGTLQAYIRARGEGSDNQGVVIDDVMLTAVPEPATWMMMLAGFGFIGAAMRRKRSIGVLA